MITRTINFTDFDGNPQSEVHNFHLGKSELIELELSVDGGIAGSLQRIIAENDNKAMAIEFKKIILASYGIREGNRFVKSPQLSEEFSQTAAYDALFAELTLEDGKAAEFINGIMPPDLVAQAQAQLQQAQTIVANGPSAQEMLETASKSILMPPPPPPAS